MSTNADGPCGSALSEGLGPNVTMPEPAMVEENPYGEPGRLEWYDAEQMHEYAGACVLAATTECSEHWQAKLDNMLAAERERWRAWVEEAVGYVGCETWSPSLKEEGEELLLALGPNVLSATR